MERGGTELKRGARLARSATPAAAVEIGRGRLPGCSPHTTLVLAWVEAAGGGCGSGCCFEAGFWAAAPAILERDRDVAFGAGGGATIVNLSFGRLVMVSVRYRDIYLTTYCRSILLERFGAICQLVYIVSMVLHALDTFYLFGSAL